MILVYLILVTTIVPIFHIHLLIFARLFLFKTDISGPVDHYDCVLFDQIELCRRSDTTNMIKRNSSICYHKENYLMTFNQLLERNVTGEELLNWNGDVDKADEYAYWYYNRNKGWNDMFVCHCTVPNTFGSSCQYQYDFDRDKDNFQSIVEKRFSKRGEYISYDQLFGNILCYKTLSCSYGLLCLDWRNICDGQQQCIDGFDEENCDKLEFNECDDDEYRCANGMCIPAEYFLDGDFDCMDKTDEKDDSSSDECFWHFSPFDCDEHICAHRNKWSCGDGQCIQASERFSFIEKERYMYQPQSSLSCINLRHLYHICEMNPWEPMWTMPSGMCWTFGEEYISNIDWNYRAINQINCQDLLRCYLSDAHGAICPCSSSYGCMEQLRRYCRHPIIYPSKPLFAPYLTLWFGRNNYDWDEPKLYGYLLNGSIKCRGYNIRFNQNITNQFDLHLNRLEYVLCSPINIFRNESIFSQQYDRYCYNQSKTFSKHPYAFSDICFECISNYRINDAFVDCWSADDEHQYQIQTTSCDRQKNYRLICNSHISSMCLYVNSIGDGNIDCQNRFDEYLQGNDVSLSFLQCSNKELHFRLCDDLKHYIVNDGVSGILVPNRFFKYCDTFWDSIDAFDESTENCRHQWACLKEHYQCLTGQCIPLKWLCDGEWDCSDGSDEEGFLGIDQLLLHNQNLINNKFNQFRAQCLSHLRERFFVDRCNLTREYPCLLANVSNPLDIRSNRPCIKLNQIGDGIINCYGGIDERNVLEQCDKKSMIGFNFRCISTNTCIPYNRLCVDRCPNGEDDIICFGRGNNRTLCTESNDALCFDKTCHVNRRCNHYSDCLYGEDEYWCDFPKQASKNPVYLYRENKQAFISSDFQKLPSFPLKTHRIRRSTLPFDTANAKPMFYCNRGIAIKHFDQQLICLCLPSYYGPKCEFFSDRLTIFTHLDLTSSSYALASDVITTISIVVYLMFEDKSIIDYHVFHVYPKFELFSPRKQRFQFVYPRSRLMLEQRRNRYFNRSDISEHHPYSIRFEAYDLTTNINLIGLWHFPIYFDYLPSFRFAKVLRLLSKTSSENRCNSNGVYQAILNKDNYYVCVCNSGYDGKNCSNFSDQCKNACSSNSICRPNGNNNRPICICPLGYFGRSCSLRYFQCDSSPCLNNGTCIPLTDPTLFRCECLSGFSGDRCQWSSKPVLMKLNYTNMDNLLYMNETYGIVLQSFSERLSTLIHQESFIGNLPESFIFPSPIETVSYITLVKFYKMKDKEVFFIISISPKIIPRSLNISTELSNKTFCPHSCTILEREQQKCDNRQAVFKYHSICRNNSELLCFHDDIYLCICDVDHQRAQCFSYDKKLDQCTSCLSNGRCLRGDLKKANDLVCLCPSCHHGRLCQFSTQIFSFTLDSLIIKEQSNIQLIYVALVGLVLLIGSLNNLCSFATFKRATARKSSFGIYLLVLTFLNQCSLLFLFLKIIHIFLGNRGVFVGFYRGNTISCKMISYFLSSFTRSNYWLTSWISIERVYVVFIPKMKPLNNIRTAICISLITVIVIFLMHIHEIISYVIIEDVKSQTLCVMDFSEKIISVYDRIIVIMHFLIPFSIQIISISLLIILIARNRIKISNKNITMIQLLTKQFKAQKDLYLTPSIIIISALPHVIISFNFACQELSLSWQRHLLISTYIFSYVPQMFGFLIYVLPSSIYKKEFAETTIAKKLFKLMQKYHCLHNQ